MNYPTWEPHVTVRALNPMVAALRALGYPAASFLESAGIEPAVLNDPDGEVPHRAMMHLWDRAVADTGDDNLGLHLGEAAPVASFDVHAYALLSSPTIRDAYRRGCRYQRLIHETTQLTLDEGDAEGVLTHALPGGQSVPRQPAEFLVTVWVRLGRLVSGDSWFPKCVCFAHAAPADTRDHTRVFGDRVVFGTGRTAMHVASAVLDKVNPRADANLAQLLDRYAGVLLGDMRSRTTLSGRLRLWLVEAHGGGPPTATEAASAMHMSVRTLHRQLRAEGTGFRQMLERFRQERATVLLARRDYGIAEVAFLLGFSELSSFYRAFRRWTGKTPADFRAQATGKPRGQSGQ